MRSGIAGPILFLLLASTAFGQSASCRFRWRKGDILTYGVVHETTVEQTVGGRATETSSRLELVKRWRVLEVNAAGAAKLELTLAALRNEQKTPSGEILRFDSANPEKSTPALRKAMEKYVGKPLAVLEIDAAGHVTSAKKGSLQRYQDEPPFQLEFPHQASGPAQAPFAIERGKKWRRRYTVTLAPPLGTGEEFAAEQTCECKSFDGRIAKIALQIGFPKLPKNPRDRIPLLQKQRQGTVVFDADAGRLLRADLRTVQDVPNHQGEGSRYRFESRYQEVFLPGK